MPRLSYFKKNSKKWSTEQQRKQTNERPRQSEVINIRLDHISCVCPLCFTSCGDFTTAAGPPLSTAARQTATRRPLPVVSVLDSIDVDLDPHQRHFFIGALDAFMTLCWPNKKMKNDPSVTRFAKCAQIVNKFLSPQSSLVTNTFGLSGTVNKIK